MTDEINITVGSQEEAETLKEEFEEVIARVNGELMSYAYQPDDPVSVEAAVVYAEQRVDANLREFQHNRTLQSLAMEMKLQFRIQIEMQARAAASGR